MVIFTTIGYGDSAPKSLPGRLVCVAASLFGICVLSLFVVTVSQIQSLDKGERKVYKSIVVDNDESKLKFFAGKLIKSYLMFTFRRRLEIIKQKKSKIKVLNFFWMI